MINLQTRTICGPLSVRRQFLHIRNTHRSIPTFAIPAITSKSYKIFQANRFVAAISAVSSLKYLDVTRWALVTLQDREDGS